MAANRHVYQSAGPVQVLVTVRFWFGFKTGPTLQVSENFPKVLRSVVRKNDTNKVGRLPGGLLRTDRPSGGRFPDRPAFGFY